MVSEAEPSSAGVHTRPGGGVQATFSGERGAGAKAESALAAGHWPRCPLGVALVLTPAEGHGPKVTWLLLYSPRFEAGDVVS